MEKLDILNILAIIGSICSILGLIISVVTSKDTIKRKIVLFFFLIVMAISIGGVVYLNSELKRIKDIHNKAESVYNDYVGCSNEEYIHEVLTFLDENQDRYPETYKRANHIANIEDESDAADALRGIIKGIIVNNNK